MKHLLIGKEEGTPVEFKVILGFCNNISSGEDIMIVNEFNTAKEHSENIIVTANHSGEKRNITQVKSTNNNILDVCVNRNDGEVVTISGTVCPVRNASCIECLRIKEFNSEKNDFVEVWVCPLSSRNIDQCKHSK